MFLPSKHLLSSGNAEGSRNPCGALSPCNFATTHVPAERIGPDVMQSGFGVNFLFWSGELWENCRRISQRILMANFDSEFFGPIFPGFQAPQKIHTQNSRPELSAFLSNFTFLNPKFIHGDFLLAGETKKEAVLAPCHFAATHLTACILNFYLP